jgi:hypothetical protein
VIGKELCTAVCRVPSGNMFSESLGAQGMWWHPAQEKVLHLFSGYATMILFSESYGDSPDNSEYESARRLR